MAHSLNAHASYSVLGNDMVDDKLMTKQTFAVTIEVTVEYDLEKYDYYDVRDYLETTDFIPDAASPDFVIDSVYTTSANVIDP